MHLMNSFRSVADFVSLWAAALPQPSYGKCCLYKVFSTLSLVQLLNCKLWLLCISSIMETELCAEESRREGNCRPPHTKEQLLPSSANDDAVVNCETIDVPPPFGIRHLT